MENTSLAAPGALAHRLQHRTVRKFQNAHQGAQKWPKGDYKLTTKLSQPFQI